MASFIRRGLKEEGFAVDGAADAAEGQYLAQTNDYDLIILDWMLPDRDGIEVVQALRAEQVFVPVLLLTAKGDLQDKVRGLNSGADDYLTKPFGFEELLARVRALTRRQGDFVPMVLQAADLKLDVLRHQVWRGGKEIELTTREYALLELFLRKRGQVVTRTMMAEHVWERDFDPFSNVIDVTIARLRRKVDGASPVKLIETVRGRGYRLKDPETES